MVLAVGPSEMHSAFATFLIDNLVGNSKDKAICNDILSIPKWNH